MKTSATVEIDDNTRSLITICLEIARDKFGANADSVALPRVAEQFRRQREQTIELLDLITNAEAIRITRGEAA